MLVQLIGLLLLIDFVEAVDLEELEVLQLRHLGQTGPAGPAVQTREHNRDFICWGTNRVPGEVGWGALPVQVVLQTAELDRYQVQLFYTLEVKGVLYTAELEKNQTQSRHK